FIPPFCKKSLGFRYSALNDSVARRVESGFDNLLHNNGAVSCTVTLFKNDSIAASNGADHGAQGELERVIDWSVLDSENISRDNRPCGGIAKGKQRQTRSPIRNPMGLF